ncbi:MAG: glycosyltransferase family 1 protein [Vulcanimicrobiaceae bacterium]
MHILTLVDNVFDPSQRGGMQTVAEELATGLIASGHDVTFLTAHARAPGSAAYDAPPHMDVVRFDPGDSPLAYLRNSRRVMRDLLRTKRFDVAHVHFAYPALGPLSALPFHVPVVRTYHGSWALETKIEAQLVAPMRRATRANVFARHAIDQLTLSRSQRVITLSEFSRAQLLRNFHVSSDRVSVIPGGIGARFLPYGGSRSDLRHRLNLPVGAFVLMTACRLVELKGVANLIDALPSIIARRPDVLCVVAGDGSARQRLEARVDELGIARHVRFLGFVDEDLLAYYQSSDIFVNASLAPETFGLVSLEALACGIPVVGTPVGATVQILADIDHRLIAASTRSSDLARSILDVAALCDRGDITPQALATTVRRRFNWKDHVRGTERVMFACKPSSRATTAQRAAT